MKLCAIPAIAPSSGGEGEAKKADFLVDWLKANGFIDIALIKAPDLDAPDGYRPNILAYYRGKSSASTIWIMTHTDIVPPGEMSLWRGNPFKAWVEKGRIYGRGVEDNQQDMVASLFAVKALQAEGIEPELRHRHRPGRRRGDGQPQGHRLRPPEPQGLPPPGPHHRPRRRQRGRDDDRGGREEPPLAQVQDPGQAGPRLDAREGHQQLQGGQLLHRRPRTTSTSSTPAKDKLFDPPISTFEPTKKEANVPNVNTIPGEDVFYMDSRILPQFEVQRGREDHPGRSPPRSRRSSRSRSTSRSQQAAPAAPPTSPQAPVVQALKKAVKAVYRQGRQGHGHRRRDRGGRLPPGRLPGGLLVQARRDRPPAERVLHHRQHGRRRQGLRPHLPAGLSRTGRGPAGSRRDAPRRRRIPAARGRSAGRAGRCGPC
ncbi:MAG: M20/M25/M40 family metallo-hydrolase [Ignavibacteriales bacterium]|nr:M20/M25/M40 family metallo-hydrolase [Ignavibacteriales bacterium]